MKPDASLARTRAICGGEKNKLRIDSEIFRIDSWIVEERIAMHRRINFSPTPIIKSSFRQFLGDADYKNAKYHSIYIGQPVDQIIRNVSRGLHNDCHPNCDAPLEHHRLWVKLWLISSILRSVLQPNIWAFIQETFRKQELMHRGKTSTQPALLRCYINIWRPSLCSLPPWAPTAGGWCQQGILSHEYFPPENKSHTGP